ncbi:MAG: tetratricopeptide repeat protein [Deltaproteobacteria bacterium]|nr:tetratricopeptide repeat protein [Deltaproteobacteria bacterium]
MRKKRRFVVVFTLAWLGSSTVGVARADETHSAPSASATDLEEGKARFAAGRAHFDKGDFKAAMDEFQAGFALTRINGFLLNIGVCQRKLGQKQEALATFDGLLKSEPNLPKRSEVERMVEQLKAELGMHEVVAPTPNAAEPEAASAEQSTPPLAAAEPSAGPSADAEEDDAEVDLFSTQRSARNQRGDDEPRRRVVPLLESSRIAAQAQPEKQDESILKSGWLWGGVGVVVLGAVAAVLLMSGRQTTSGSIGTVDLR